MDTLSPESNEDDQYPDVIFQTTEEIEKAAEMEKLEKRLENAGVSAMTGSLLAEYMKRIEEMQVDGCNQAESGLVDLDKKINGGFMPGQLIIVAGRPSMGKSAFAQGIAENVANADKQKAVLFFSLEMSKFEIMDRFLCKHAGISMSKLKTKGLTKDDYAKMVAILPFMARTPLFICDKSSLTVSEMIKVIADFRQACEFEQKQFGLVIVDYLQLLSVKHPKANREAEISEMTRTLKVAAREVGVPIMALSQLNRGLENRTEKRPQMADLRESGAIEQDADVIIGLYREEVYSKNKEEVKGVAEAIILKNRNGELATIRMLFDGARFEFKNAAADRYADYNKSHKDDVF